MAGVVRTLTGRRIAIRMVAWRSAPHNHADQADIGRQSLRLFCPHGLLVVTHKSDNLNKINYMINI